MISKSGNTIEVPHVDAAKFGIYAGVKLRSDNSVYPTPAYDLKEPYGAQTDTTGTNGSAFIEFVPVASGSSAIPLFRAPTTRNALFAFGKARFDNSSDATFLHVVHLVYAANQNFQDVPEFQRTAIGIADPPSDAAFAFLDRATRYYVGGIPDEGNVVPHESGTFWASIPTCRAPLT